MSSMVVEKKNKKILIVEDNELNLQLFTDLLEAHGFSTFHTREAEEALSIARKEKPHLIIMDIQLPHVSGMDIIRTIKAEKDLKEIPIVAITAFAMADDERRIRAAGCDGYMAKPISINSFLDTVNHYLHMEQPAQ